ncbi:MAG TPA: hypothetical protein VFU23_16720, partial [Gemmatimonadales bacterium]|nr:hypothetical protein [Gemmatimonadales bacterium]
MKLVSSRAATALISLGLASSLGAGCGTTDSTIPDAPPTLRFLDQPRIAPAGDPLGVLRIGVLDSKGHPVSEPSRQITLSIEPGSGPGGLTGTATAQTDAGVATFLGIAVSAPGSHYRLRASSSGLTSVLTDPFVAPMVVAIARAGDTDTCALHPSGKLYCWGQHGATLAGGAGPASVMTPVSSAVPFVDFALAAGNICATDGAQLYCWGTGFGIGTPTLLPGHSFSRFTVNGHACGTEGGGLLSCWGRNDAGQLGRGTVGPPDPVPGLIVGSINGYEVTNGAAHSCALGGEVSGTAYCWGSNSEGQLGNGTTVASSVPVAVSTQLRFLLLRAGAEFSCGMTATRAAYCWGRNNELQLGNSAAGVRSLTPVLVAGGLAFVDLFVGQAHACGTLATGEAYCWGRNTHGELGNGTSGAP